MPQRRPQASPPSKASEERLEKAQTRLRAFPQAPPGASDTSPAATLASCEADLRALLKELEDLIPWFDEFFGSSVVVTFARRAVGDTLEEIELHSDTMHEPPATVVPLIVRPVREVVDRLDPVINVLPEHVQLADRLEERRQPLRVRIAAMPHRLKVKYYLGIFFGVFLLLSVAGLLIVLLDPAVDAALGVTKLLNHYAAADAGYVLVGLFALSGVRLLLGSVWLSRSIKILPAYEEQRVDEARKGLRDQETQVLDRLAPRSAGPAPPDGLEGIFPPPGPPKG